MSDIVRDVIAGLTSLLPRLALTPLAPFGYGVDLLCVTDIDDNLTEVDPDSTLGMAQDAYHRITTTRGTNPDDQDYGRNLFEYLHRGATPADLLAMGGELEGELSKDDRFDLVTVAVVATSKVPLALNVTVEITPKDPTAQTFAFLVAVTNGQALFELL